MTTKSSRQRVAYRPMMLGVLAGHLGAADDEVHRRRLIAEFLEELRAEPRELRVELLAAVPLASEARRAGGIDAVIRNASIGLHETHELADELGLPRWWLNAQASGYLAPRSDPRASLNFDHLGLRVSTASREHLLSADPGRSACD